MLRMGIAMGWLMVGGVEWKGGGMAIVGGNGGSGGMSRGLGFRGRWWGGGRECRLFRRWRSYGAESLGDGGPSVESSMGMPCRGVSLLDHGIEGGVVT